MSTHLPIIPVSAKSGNESFSSNDLPIHHTIQQYWQWAYSDIISNASRGILAEYIVGMALGLTKGNTRSEWEPFDLLYKDVKIEVKSAAYIQAWNQKEYSNISFNIYPAHAWDPNTNEFSGERKRWSDVYVFCVLAHKDQATLDPLDLDQWDFYVLPTKVLNKQCPEQKTIALSSLLRLGPTKVGFEGILESVERVSG